MDEYFYLCIIYSFLTIIYTFNQEIHLATNFTYTVQYPEVLHRTAGSTSVLNQFSAVQGSLLDIVGNYYIYTNIL